MKSGSCYQESVISVRIKIALSNLVRKQQSHEMFLRIRLTNPIPVAAKSGNNNNSIFEPNQRQVTGQIRFPLAFICIFDISIYIYLDMIVTQNDANGMASSNGQK